MREITASHADKLTELIKQKDQTGAERALAMYAEDFGTYAAERLIAHCRHVPGPRR